MTHIYAGNVHPISLNNVDQIIRRAIRLSNGHIGIGKLVLAQHGLDLVVVDVRQGNGVSDSNPPLFFFAHSDVGWLLV